MATVIVSDPEILGVRQVFRGTRAPVEVLFENLEDGLTLDEIVASYPGLVKSDLISEPERRRGITELRRRRRQA